MSGRHPRVVVVLPCFNVADSIANVISRIPDNVWRIYCVNDASDDSTGEAITALAAEDARLVPIERDRNGGVGAAFMDGMTRAIADGAEVIVKIDGDGQMNGAFVTDFAAPIIAGDADFVKGNRFFDIESVLLMPRKRMIGNAGLSFFSKLSTGYWHLFDPTNGYIAIHAGVAALLPAHKIHKRYFFESDLLFRLSILRAKVVELPLETVYGDEVSGLREWRCLLTFPLLHLRNFMKRIFYNYMLRGFSLGSIELIAGVLMTLFGTIHGVRHWIISLQTQEPATAGTVMLSALPIIVGIQLILNFLAQDIASTPGQAVQNALLHKRTLVTERAAGIAKK